MAAISGSNCGPPQNGTPAGTVNKMSGGSAEIRTQVSGIRIRHDNQLHYGTFQLLAGALPVGGLPLLVGLELQEVN